MFWVYCESTIGCGVPTFLVFVSWPNHEILVSNKKDILIYAYTENLSTKNSRINEPVFLPYATKIGNHELKYFNSIHILSLTCFTVLKMNCILCNI